MYGALIPRGLGGRLAVALTAGLMAATPAAAEIPQELYDALGIASDAPPNVLYDAVAARYRDTTQGAGQGKFADLWEPIAFSAYLDPTNFYTARDDLDFDVQAGDCTSCHENITPSWVHTWQSSVHGDLNAIRALPDDDSRAYKKAMIEEVEGNLHSMGLLAEGAQLGQVGCADCHMGVGSAGGNHKTDLKLPDAASCGQCHVQQFAERESERDTLTWPQGQWPDGRPSHALSLLANYETAIWAGMAEREIAEGCTMCHTTQATCNQCHTRHEFSAAQARKPEVCSNCHNGVDHNEFEAFMLSRHGIIYQTGGEKWDWEAPLSEAFASAGYTAPTCQTCHMETNGSYGHNLVQKVRWGFAPMPSIAENLDHPWFEDRKELWLTTCSQCHSRGFGSAYFEMIDKGTTQGIGLVQQAEAVVKGLYDDGLLIGQANNRPAPPAPDEDTFGGFFGLFWTEGNNPSAVEYEYAQMWEQEIMRHFKGLAHANPGGFTYTYGWSELIGSLARIKDEDTRLRERAALRAKIEELEAAAAK
ncbi:MAG: hydroxylamine reductase [Alphaproteobacteria bacterium HGW-Alphaproteobacteria-1]|jgi:hydroxylamine dehydrogenase|nr:MAG: hydroxylamine reductase [Alphaproteobacteria bacterium HGW-Alphaproteobacteria-1]